MNLLDKMIAERNFDWHEWAHNANLTIHESLALQHKLAQIQAAINAYICFGDPEACGMD